MNRILVMVGVLGLAALVLEVGALPAPRGHGDDAQTTDGRAPVIEKPEVAVDPRVVMGLICDGRPDSALSILNAKKHENTSDPMVHLLRARAMREMMSDEDDNKELIKGDAEPILVELDGAIAICDAAQEHSASDPVYWYYRGRAWLGKAQIHTLTRSYWSAGRAASKAKKDLEHYLQFVPDDPDAQGDLGAFLYFADTLPGVIKFISRLLLIPGGDRDRGMELLRYAASNDGAFSADYQVAIAAIYLLFEGRFEEGVVAMQELIARYPGYTRLVEPFGVLAPLYPLKIREFQELEDRVITRHVSRGSAHVNWSLVKRIQLHRSYSNMFFLDPSQALFEMTTLVENPPSRPDWVLPLALIHRGHLYAKRGDTDRAIAAFDTVASRDDMEHFHGLARGLVRTLEKPWKVVDLEDLRFVGSIYDGDLKRAETGLNRYDSKYGRDVVYYFYLGELELFAQDFVAAARAYGACLDVEVYGGDQTYQMFAALRLGEIHGHEANYEEARDYFEKATKYSHAGYLFDFMVHSRRRYFETLDDGKIKTPPSLLLRHSGGRAVTPDGEGSR